MTAPISVLVEIKHDEVHIQELASTPDGLALDSLSPYEHLGTIVKRKVPGTRRDVIVWSWESEGQTGEESTKDKAVAAMLADAGYVGVKLTATIPDLLDGLTGDAA